MLFYFCLLHFECTKLHYQNELLVAEIVKLLRTIGKSLKQFSQLPQPPLSYLQTGSNNLVVDETCYNIEEMEQEFNKLYPHCNEEQLAVYDSVM